MVCNFIKNSEKMRKIINSISFFKIDFSFILLFILAFFLESVKVYFIYVIFLLIHEMSHFIVAKKLGYFPEKVHLSFFGASLEGYDDFDFYDEVKIVIAGPFFNFIVVILCYILFWFFPETSVLLEDILVCNLSIFLFNVLPVYPLDMGRLILAKLSKKNKRIDALKNVKNLSIVVIIFLFILFLITFFFEFNFALGFVCVNLMSLLFSSSKSTSYKRQLFVFKKLKNISKGLFEKTIYIDSKTEKYKLLKFIDNSHYFKFVLLNERGEKVSELSEIELYKENDLI